MPMENDDLGFLFDAVSDLLHMAGTGGADELRADKFDERRRALSAVPALSVKEIAELILSATGPLAEEVGRLRKRVDELEGHARLRDSETIELAPDPEGG